MDRQREPFLGEMTAMSLKVMVLALFLGKEILERMTPHMKQLIMAPMRDWMTRRATAPGQMGVSARPPYPIVV